MKGSATAALLLVVCLSVQLGQGQGRRLTATEQARLDGTACALVRQIHAHLASAKTLALFWNVRYVPQYACIEIEREEPVLMAPEAMINGPVTAPKPELRRPLLSLRVQPLVSRAQFERWQRENAALDARLAQMRQGMRDIGGKFDSFSPRTPEQARRVDAYRRLKSARHELPDYFFRGISVSWLWYPGQFVEFRRPTQDPAFLSQKSATGIEAEEARIARIVLNQVLRYEPGEKSG